MPRAVRLVCLGFDTGRITRWVKVPGGVPHRVEVVGPLSREEMRAVEYDPAVIERFRLGPQVEDGGPVDPLVA